jgi:uncharacterized protein
MNSKKIKFAALVGVGALGVVLAATGISKFRAKPKAVPPPSVSAADVASIKARAESGEPAGQNALGDLYAKGEGLPQSFGEAFKWYRAGAEKGLAGAQYNLAMLYETGQGVHLDEAEAATWHRKAAAQGHAGAAYNLAAMYATGRGVPRDAAEAAKFYLQAAELGDSLAQYNLARRYEVGKGVSADLVEAYKWHRLAARQGIEDAAKAIDHLKGQLTRDQVTDAERRADAFVAKNPATVPAK